MPEWNLPEKPISGLLYLLRNYKGIFIGSVISQFIVVIASISRYFLLGFFVDGILESIKIGGNPPIAPFALAYIGIAAVMGLFSLFSTRGFSKTSELIARDVRDELFDHIQKLSFSYHDQTSVGDLIQRVTADVEVIRQYFNVMLRDLIRITFIFVLSLISIFILSWYLALISMIISPFLALTSYLAFRRMKKTFTDVREQGGKLSSLMQENISGIRVVKAFSNQIYEKDRFDEESVELRRLGIRHMRNHAFFWPTSDILVGIQVAIGYLTAGIMAISGAIIEGVFVSYLGLIGNVIWPMKNVGRIISETSTVFVSYNRIWEIAKEKQEALDEGITEGVMEGDIEFKNVSFGYAKNAQILKNVSFQIKKGDVVVLLGEAGSGKTSLINLLPRFYDDYDGEITLDGKSLKDYSKRFLRTQIGIVEQEPFLFSTSIRGNITYGVPSRVSEEKIEGVSEASAIHESIMTFPDNYSTIVGERGVTLSGGQKQRIAIARTLLKAPSIIIFDDSTSSVDIETEMQIRNSINVFGRNKTTFIITHRIDEETLSIANLILVFREGKIIQRGTHEELIKEPGFYKEIFSLQRQIETEIQEELKNG